jgi:lipopolysaccharide/colanic/teichoic acid biosynthesis glycosyltransferase
LGTTNSSWLQYLLHPAHREAWPLSKRLLDLVVGGIGALIALPILLLSALAIKLSDRGPVLYRQKRIGENGREIDLIKLRTMRPDADELWVKGVPEDQLVTRVGRMLRRLHFNELPQLWHVLTGEMSLVGPRPEIPEIVSRLEQRFEYYDRRHLLKPGITGWATVCCGYSATAIGEAWKLCYDLYYLKRRSLLFDLLILVETASSVLLPERGVRPNERFLVGAETAHADRGRIAALPSMSMPRLRRSEGARRPGCAGPARDLRGPVDRRCGPRIRRDPGDLQLRPRGSAVQSVRARAA